MELYSEIENLMRSGRWEEASLAVTSMLVDHPGNAKLNGYLGLCEFRQGKYEDALAPLERAAALDPTFVDAGVKLAQTYDRLHRYHECAVVAKQFLVRRPGDHTLEGLLDAHELDLSLDREGWEKHQYITAARAKLTNR